MAIRIKGFTLFEILISLSIISIVLASVLPSCCSFVERYKKNLSNLQLLNAIQTARQEAIVRGEVVRLCKSQDFRTCGGKSWQEGYIIIAGDKRLYAFQHRGNKAGDMIYWRARLHMDELQFLPSGLTRAENGSFLYCQNGAENPVWVIILNKVGRARVVYPNENNEILDSLGKRIEC